MEIQQIKIKRLHPNEGQIEGLPTNPRQIKKKAFDSLKKSIKDAPEMLHLRELIVYPYGDDFVVIGGNMRLRACRELGFEELPCKVLPVETPAEKLREYAIKDNVEAGEDDWDVLANEWNAEELTEWGMEIEPLPSDFDDVIELPNTQKGLATRNFTLSNQQAEFIDNAIQRASKDPSKISDKDNKNINGNALYKIVKEWDEQQK